MAIKHLEMAPLPEKVRSRGGRSGGGKFGTISGLVAGAALGATAAAVPGAAPAAIAMGGISGAGGGAALGGLLGEQIRPGREASTAVERRIQSQTPQPIRSEAAEKLRQSLVALHEAPPEVKSRYAPTLLTAYLSEEARLRPLHGGAAQA